VPRGHDGGRWSLRRGQSLCRSGCASRYPEEDRERGPDQDRLVPPDEEHSEGHWSAGDQTEFREDRDQGRSGGGWGGLGKPYLRDPEHPVETTYEAPPGDSATER